MQKTEADLALLTQEVPKRVTISEMRLEIAKEDDPWPRTFRSWSFPPCFN